ncbi:MAG: BamA/TamA family outer membrane protein [Betaproteobacteria bacterium]|nr:BamA/TamA family outer membrane protein [Betaproteobacteria bacterium]
MSVRATLACALLALFAASAGAKEPPATLPVTWEAPEELKVHFEKHLKGPPPEAKRDRLQLRRWIREVRRRAPEIAAAEGWFSAKVEIDDDIEPVHVKVEPGERTVVAGIAIAFKGDVAGEGAFREARREALRSAWALPEGKPFRTADWEEAKARLLEALTADDYAAGRVVSSEGRVDATTAKARLAVVLDSGPAFSLGEVEIVGLTKYPSKVVERLIDVDPGEPYRSDRLLDLQRTLQNTPYFAGVTVEIERDPAKPQRVPVRVTLIERPVADVGLSAGYGTDSGARGEVSLRYRNAFGLGFDNLSALQADKTRQIGYADFYLPTGAIAAPIVGTQATKDSVGILGEHTFIEGLDTQRVAVAAYRQFLKGPFDVRVGVSYQVEQARPEGSESSLKRALAPNATVTWRFVDDVLNPKTGGVLQVQAAVGSKAFLSDQDFVKAYAQYQHWFTPTPKDQFIVRAEFGKTFAPSREGVPEDFLYRAGGTRSVRGYKYQSLGVKDGEATVGGRYLATGTLEYVRWVNPTWGAAAFLDAGDAADTRDTLGANLGYGLGVRFRTPAGPLAFDLAYADRDRRVRAVFSVSVAF